MRDGAGRDGGRGARPGVPLQLDPAWELVACYGPRPEVWGVSACGTVFVVRRRPDGGEAFLGAWLSLGEGGVQKVFGAAASAAGEGLAERADIAPLLPPMGELSPEAAADYLYGALAWGEMLGRPVDGEVLRRARLLAEPVGGPEEWRQRLVGPGGLTPPELVRVLGENAPHEHLPEGKEVLIITAATVALAPGSGAGVARRLLERKGSPEFFETDGGRLETVLEWLRPYPRGRRPLLDGPGARQAMGSLAVRDAGVALSAMTLSRAAALMGALLEAAGGCAPQVVATTWSGVDDLVPGRPGS